MYLRYFISYVTIIIENVQNVNRSRKNFFSFINIFYKIGYCCILINEDFCGILDVTGDMICIFLNLKGWFYMILLSTKFPVIQDLTPDVLSDMLSDWIGGSAHYSLPLDYHGESEYEVASDDGSQVLKIYRIDDKFAVQLTKMDDSSIFTNTYILSIAGDECVVFVQLCRDFLKPTQQRDFPLRIPKLMRMIFWQEYGGLDGNISVDDKSLIIRRNNMGIAKEIVLNECSYMNPIVYVSPYAENGTYATNYEKLASDLLGIAHVVVEGSPYISEMISAVTDDKNPQNGDVTIFLPTGERKDFKAATTQDLTKNVVGYVRDIMSVVTPGEEFSFQRIRYNYLLSKASELAGGNSELEELCDAMLKEKDDECEKLRKELDSVKRDLHNANSHVESLQAGLDAAKEDGVAGVQLNVTESEFYDGELKDVILKVLAKEYNSLNTDKRAGKSRKVSVLKDIIDNNPVSGKEAEIQKAFKECVKDGVLQLDKLSDVERFGFQVALDGKKHHKVTFNGDARYQMSVSTTPSDHRAGENLASAYLNMLFGY